MARPMMALAIWAAAAALAAPASGAVQLTNPPPPLKVLSEAPVTLPNVQRLTVRSQRVGREFTIDVSVPSPIAVGVKLPVIYALDAGYGVVIPEAGMLGWTGGMQPAVIITIGYPRDAANLRLVDMLYAPATVNGRPTGGGGAAFQGFLLEELRPLIEARYPVDPARSILFGHSVGGLFAANLLAARPQAFNGYLIASPSIWADPGVLERAKAAAGAAEKQRVFLAVGGNEDAGMQQGAARLAAALNANFQLQTRVYRDEGHLSYYPQLVATAFPWLLPPTPAGPAGK